MKVHILDVVYRHLRNSARFYERQRPGLGSHFRTSILEDIERLEITAGAHEVVYRGFHRSISRKFPFAIYYRIESGQVWVHAVVDSRRNPNWIRKQLR